jgi:flagellar motility protein MotE (MotC chaperone)
MFLKKILFKPNLIAFYKEEEKYKVLNEQYKKNKIIFTETKEFESKKDLTEYIKCVTEDNPQTYVSTVIITQNQGVIPSCDKHYYKNLGIDTENIKFICINNKYSFYTTLYELMETKKEYPCIDFLYSAFAIIDRKSSLRKNSLYVLVTKEHCFILIYKDSVPEFADIFETEEEIIEDEEIEDISDMDIIDDFEDSLDENIENIEEPEDEDENSNIDNLNIEYKILEHIKTALKEYYENNGDFIEKIFIFDTIGMEKNITDLINEDIFIQSEIKPFDILKTINEISRENV